MKTRWTSFSTFCDDFHSEKKRAVVFASSKQQMRRMTKMVSVEHDCYEVDPQQLCEVIGHECLWIGLSEYQCVSPWAGSVGGTKTALGEVTKTDSVVASSLHDCVARRTHCG